MSAIITEKILRENPELVKALTGLPAEVFGELVERMKAGYGEYEQERLERPDRQRANGALGAYLVRRRAVRVTEPTTRILSEQGAEINRPSLLFVEVDSAGEDISAVRVGGQVVLVAEGTLRF